MSSTYQSRSPRRGGNEQELMLVAGWTSRIMIDRYTTATASQRARASDTRLSPADRL